MTDHPLPIVYRDPPVDAINRPAPNAGMFDLDRLEKPPADWPWAIAPAVLAWLGSVAFLGQFRSNQIAESMADVVPLAKLFWACLILTGFGCLILGISGRSRHSVLWASVFGYLVGHLLFSIVPIHPWVRFSIPFNSPTDGLAFAGHRLIYGVCVALCIGICVILSAWSTRAWPQFYLGLGSWSTLGRDFTYRSKPETYRKAMLGFALFAAILWIVGQMSVELKPLRGGWLWGLLPAIFLAAIVNAAIEEVIYRGLLQPAFLQAAGIARGIWLQGLLFGLLHWGLSVGVVAALPTSLLIGVGAVFWGKAMLDTRGISWVICAHAMVDVAILCAYFVP